jgi:hypothetical protein
MNSGHLVSRQMREEDIQARLCSPQSGPVTYFGNNEWRVARSGKRARLREEIAGLVRMTIDTVDGLITGAALAAQAISGHLQSRRRDDRKSSAHLLIAVVDGIADRTPKRRAS